MGSLSEVLKQRRKALGLTLAQIADAMGVAEATVQRWESGNIKSVRQAKIAKLAEILGVSPAALMGWEENEAAPAASSVRAISNDELKFALWGDPKDIDDEDLEDVRQYAAFVKERKKAKK